MQSFRAYKLATLRLTALMISDRSISNHLRIQKIQKRLRFSARLSIFLSSLFISMLATGFVFVKTNQPYFSGIVFITLLIIPSALTLLPSIMNLLISSKRYTHSRLEIQELEKDTKSAFDSAVNYQRHLEIESGPGFIAIYEDIILSDGFETDLSMQLRKEIVKASLEGRGASIKLEDYRSLLSSLKQQVNTDVIRLSSIVDSVQAQSDEKATVSFASFIANEYKNLGSSALRIVAITGLHTSLSYNFQSYVNSANENWLLMQNIFKDCLEDNTEQLLLHIEKFDQSNPQSLFEKSVANMQ